MSYDRDAESLKATELRLGLPGTDETSSGSTRGVKRTLDEADSRSEAAGSTATEDEVAPPKPKAQVVGWPPVRSSYRKNNSFQAKKKTTTTADEAELAISASFVKVSMDGAPYLRKIDLKVYKGYKELREALENMFRSFSLGKLAAATEEGCDAPEHAIAYEDKDGDWMLVGDVPWGMFISSCNRLRIMRGSEARGFGSSQ
ncbi:auxin-induced protein 22D-like [Iris pallida]|uniref:Auxin-responsive protein n=1 Tax=Iris pallida TaxID=29817 RepID=A0AAX6I139_IRIPA|nr:auxin-induced protein 22D-like [Iris pallida]